MNSTGTKSMIFGVVLAVTGLIFFILAISNSNNPHSSSTPAPIETVYTTPPAVIEYLEQEESVEDETNKSSNSQLRKLESQASQIIATEISKNPTFERFGTELGEVDLLKNPDVINENWKVSIEEDDSITYELLAEQEEGTQAFIVLTGDWRKFSVSAIVKFDGQGSDNYTKTYYKTLTGEYIGD